MYFKLLQGPVRPSIHPQHSDIIFYLLFYGLIREKVHFWVSFPTHQILTLLDCGWPDLQSQTGLLIIPNMHNSKSDLATNTKSINNNYIEMANLCSWWHKVSFKIKWLYIYLHVCLCCIIWVNWLSDQIFSFFMIKVINVFLCYVSSDAACNLQSKQ